MAKMKESTKLAQAALAGGAMMESELSIYKFTIHSRSGNSSPDDLSIISNKRPTFEDIHRYWCARNHRVTLGDNTKEGRECSYHVRYYGKDVLPLFIYKD